MGTGASSRRQSPEPSFSGTLFIDLTTLECADLFTVANSSTDFVKFIKDGNWIDNLFKTKILYYRNIRPKLKTCSISFLPTTSSLVPSDADETLSSFRSARSSRSSRDGTEPPATDLCTVLEDRTCFSSAEMMSCLFSIIYPLYLTSFKSYDKLLNGEEAMDVETFTNLGEQEAQMHKLQEILLDAAAVVEEAELKTALESSNWLEMLEVAVKTSALGICVCSVEQVEGSTTIVPVLSNDRAKRCSAGAGAKGPAAKTSPGKKDSKEEKGLPPAPHRVRHPFLKTWGIEDEENYETDLLNSLILAQPLRLIAKKCVGKARVVVDVSHIFDDQGVHKYVLAVMMDIPQDSGAKRRMQYLSDTSLLLSHMIKVPCCVRPPSSESTRAGSSVVPPAIL